MSETKKILDYLGASKGNRNVGTRVKLQILEAVIEQCINLKDLTLPSFVSLLSLRCNVTPRTMREGYIEPLIDVGILEIKDNTVYFIGIPKLEPDLTDEEKEKIVKEALEK